MKLNGTYQLLVYADVVNLLGDNINTAKTNEEAPTNASYGGWSIIIIIIIIIIIFSWVRLSPLCTEDTTGLLYQPQMIDDGDYGAISGMKIGRGNLSIRRKPAQAPVCPPQIPHD
jgi:hypothetical protein